MAPRILTVSDLPGRSLKHTDAGVEDVRQSVLQDPLASPRCRSA